MALGPDEVWRGGFVVDQVNGVLIVTTNSAGATWQNGFLRDPDGRLVVVSA